MIPLFLISRSPKIFMVLSSVISVFLLCFLMIGCTQKPSAYSSVYLTKFAFNTSSGLYNSVASNFSDEDSADLDTMGLKVGYLGICVSFNDFDSCSTYSNLTWLSQYSNIELVSADSSDSSGVLDLASIAKNFREACYSNIVVTATILSLILMALVFWVNVPCVPGKFLGLKLIIIASAANTLVWGLGAMLQHEATLVANKLVPGASMNVVEAKVGSRAEALSWTAFAFLILTCITGCFLYFVEVRRRKREDSEMKIPPKY